AAGGTGGDRPPRAAPLDRPCAGGTDGGDRLARRRGTPVRAGAGAGGHSRGDVRAGAGGVGWHGWRWPPSPVGRRLVGLGCLRNCRRAGAVVPARRRRRLGAAGAGPVVARLAASGIDLGLAPGRRGIAGTGMAMGIGGLAMAAGGCGGDVALGLAAAAAWARVRSGPDGDAARSVRRTRAVLAEWPGAGGRRRTAAVAAAAQSAGGGAGTGLGAVRALGAGAGPGAG